MKYTSGHPIQAVIFHKIQMEPLSDLPYMPQTITVNILFQDDLLYFMLPN